MSQFTDRRIGPTYVLLCSALVFCSCAGIAQGQTTIDWNNPAGGSYTTASNWTPANVPNTATETARFNLAASYETSFVPNSSTTIGDLLVHQGDVLFRNAGLNNDATLNISGNAQIDGGTLTLARTTGNADVNLSIAGELLVGFSDTGTLSVADGAVVSNSSGRVGFFPGSTGTATVTGGGSQWNNSSDLFVGFDGTGTLNVEAGGVVSNILGSIGNSTGSTGTATVTGDGSQWNNSGSLVVGNVGTGTLNVEAGGVVSDARGYLGSLAGSTGTASVTGSGSQWNNPSGLYVGGSLTTAGGTGSLTIADDGLVNVAGFAGRFKIWDQGTVTLDGGHVVTDIFNNASGGSLNWLAGSLTINFGVEVGSGTAFPVSLTLGTHQTLITPATTTVAANRTLVLNGGQLTTNNLDVDGALQFDRGTLELTGGTVTGLTQLNVPTGGTLRAAGVYSLPVSGSIGSAIVATGILTLGDATNASGFGTAGTLDVGQYTVTLNDANDVVLDSLASVTMGNGSGPGTLIAAGGLTLDFGGNIAGHGTVDTPDNAATPLTNNGHIAGNSGAEPITLTGYVKGVGTLDNVVITGTDAPGFSPATVVRGSVVYGGVLEIEIGDTVPGDFDQINHILGAGIAELGGVLDVSLIGGFSPALDDSFAIITASGGVNGTFSTLADELPALSSGLEWAIDYGTNNVVLSVVTAGLPGDYNQNGTVDTADYTLWRNNLGSDTSLPNDDTAGVGEDDYTRWKSHFGETVNSGQGSGANAAVPEPAALSLVAAALAGIVVKRSARSRRRV